MVDKPAYDPTIEDAAELARQWLLQNDHRDIEVDWDKESLKATRGSMTIQVNLTNLLHRLCLADASERDEVVVEFMSAVNENQNPRSEETYDTARVHLRPIVRDEFAGITRLQVPAGSPDNLHPYLRPSIGDMVEGLALDRPTSMELVAPRVLERWGVSFDEAWSQALKNLRAESPPAWRKAGPGVWVGAWNDGYDSSRILLPEVVKPLALQVPVAMVPYRGAMLVAEGSNPQALETMVRLAGEHAQKNPGWVSFKLLWLSGNKWSVMTPPSNVAKPLRVLEMMHLANSYGSQARLLAERFQETGEDVFVASQRIFSRDDTGPVSMAVWTRGVPSLLPVSDLVTLMRVEKGLPFGRVYMLPWTEMMERFGRYLDLTEHLPRRYRTVGFPSNDELDELPVTFTVGGPG